VQRANYGEQFHGEKERGKIHLEKSDVDLKDINVERSNGVSLRRSSALFTTRRIDTRVPERTVQLRSLTN